MAAAAAPFTQQPVYPAPSPMYGMPYVPQPRVQRNLQTLGVLWCLYAGYRLIAALIGMFFVHAFATRSFGDGFPFSRHYLSGDWPIWMGVLMPVIAAVTVVAVGLSLFVGWSLLTRKPWGRVLAIVAAVLALFKFPVGTALGIYTLWVLASGASGMEWEAIADRS